RLDRRAVATSRPAVPEPVVRPAGGLLPGRPATPRRRRRALHAGGVSATVCRPHPWRAAVVAHLLLGGLFPVALGLRFRQQRLQRRTGDPPERPARTLGVEDGDLPGRRPEHAPL